MKEDSLYCVCPYFFTTTHHLVHARTRRLLSSALQLMNRRHRSVVEAARVNRGGTWRIMSLLGP